MSRDSDGMFIPHFLESNNMRFVFIGLEHRKGPNKESVDGTTIACEKVFLLSKSHGNGGNFCMASDRSMLRSARGDLVQCFDL